MKKILMVLVLLISTNLYSWDEVEYFDSKPNPNIIKEQEKRLKDRDRRDSDYYDRRDRNSDYDRNDKYDRRDSDYNDRRDRNSDYNDYNDRRDRNSDYNDYDNRRDKRDSYRDYNDKDYNDKRDSGYRDYKDYDNYNRRDSDYNDGDRRDRDYREYDNRDRDREHRRERDKEKIIWEEVSKEDSINGYKAFLKTFPNSYYANLAKYKIEKLTSYGEIDAKALEAYKNIPYWVTNGELEDKSEQCAVASIDLDRDNQIKSLREVEKQAKDILSRNHYLLSTDIIKTNFYILDKKIYALAYVYNNSKAERNKKMFYKQH